VLEALFHFLFFTLGEGLILALRHLPKWLYAALAILGLAATAYLYFAMNQSPWTWLTLLAAFFAFLLMLVAE